MIIFVIILKTDFPSDIYKLEGIRGLWRGLGPNLVGVIPAR